MPDTSITVILIVSATAGFIITQVPFVGKIIKDFLYSKEEEDRAKSGKPPAENKHRIY